MAETQARTLIRIMNKINSCYSKLTQADHTVRHAKAKRLEQDKLEIRNLLWSLKCAFHQIHEDALRLRLAELESWVLPVDVADFEKLEKIVTELE